MVKFVRIPAITRPRPKRIDAFNQLTTWVAPSKYDISRYCPFKIESIIMEILDTQVSNFANFKISLRTFTENFSVYPQCCEKSPPPSLQTSLSNYDFRISNQQAAGASPPPSRLRLWPVRPEKLQSLEQRARETTVLRTACQRNYSP